MVYYGKHRIKAHSPRIQEKIENLKMVTEKLRKNGKYMVNIANFNDAIAKLNLQ
jgi:hypothetical protein